MTCFMCALTATCLLAQAEKAPIVPARAATSLTAPMGLPYPTAAPLCPRLRATTYVLFGPIPMPLDMISDPPVGPLRRWWNGKPHGHRSGRHADQ